jgi:hypothetical protein
VAASGRRVLRPWHESRGAVFIRRDLRSAAEPVEMSLREGQLFADTVAGREDELALAGYLECEVPWYIDA